MKIIIPMAGMGTRLRPHTLTIPKPLIRIAGKSIVQRLAEDIIRLSPDPVDEIAFIIGNFGTEVENNLLNIASGLGAKGSIYYQHQAMGTAHAILCAAPSLQGNVTVAFADTLFKANFHLDTQKESVIWVQEVEHPEKFGVVKTAEDGCISDFIEKPAHFVSNKAIIGIYYFRSGEQLRDELQYLIDHDLKVNNEYQLTDALSNLLRKGVRFYTDSVDEWLDCGNKDATVNTHQRILFHSSPSAVPPTAMVENAEIIPPCFIGENVKISGSRIGPYVSIDEGSSVENSKIENSMVGRNAQIKNAEIKNAMVGNFVEFSGVSNDLSLGDYSTMR